ncbi:MAG: hypothetical protein H7X94_04530 [Vallitaleaceae bacterium]|nr:hypothetical protein [Vallitaleaceae bacterium]
MGDKRKRFGDRYDGKYLRKADPFYKIIPYIMKTRVDSQVYFDEKIDILKTDQFIKNLRKEEHLRVGFLHIMIAAMVRTISQKPRINRFVSGRKIFARNEIAISLAIKKQMNEDAPETAVKVIFKPTDTLYDVVYKINEAINANKVVGVDNDSDKLAKLIMLCPGFIVKFIVNLLTFLDNRGKLPKIVHNLSPFHTSVFVTDLGSLGIQPIYHHIYEFGTTSLFIAFGLKNTERIMNSEGNTIEHKYINMKVVADERICDGYYFSTAFKTFIKYIEKPSSLLVAPEKVVEDHEI